MPSSNSLIGQLNNFSKNLSVGKKMALITLVACTLAGCIVVMMWAGRPDFGVLYSNLLPKDAGAILEKLKEQKIPYQISANGNTIQVPRDIIHEKRLDFASEGLPQGSGVGFEIFDNTKLGMTEFVHNVNFQRALQGELSRTINGLEEIDTSRVHIVMPSKSLFIDEEESGTASVVIKLHAGRHLSQEQIQGIVHLVSSSVSGLNAENVILTDNHGKMLSGFKDRDSISQTGYHQYELQGTKEKKLEDSIKTMLEKALGVEKAIVRVSCILDFKRHEKTEEIYNPRNKVPRSEQIFNETSDVGLHQVAMGTPLTASNISPSDSGNTKPMNKQLFQKQDKTVNYEIGKVTSHTIEPTGIIKKISVAVIVDGSYKKLVTKDKKESWEYIPRTKEEMVKIENIVKTAVNFDQSRGDEIEVVNISFESARLKFTDDQQDMIKPAESWLSKIGENKILIRYGLLGLFIFCVFIFVARPLVRWMTSGEIVDMALLEQLPKTVAEIEQEYAHGSKNLPFRDRAVEMLANDNSNSIDLMKGWLKEG